VSLEVSDICRKSIYFQIFSYWPYNIPQNTECNIDIWRKILKIEVIKKLRESWEKSL